MAAFGVTTPMVSIVLSIFMAGLALGSWAGPSVRSLENRPAGFFISLYGAIELAIGVSGLAVAPLLRAGRTLLSAQGASWGSGDYYLASAAWVGLVMLPFCTCMGTTFPLAMAGIRAAFRAKSATSFSYLYLANVLGAMAGAVGSAFFFIELLGFSENPADCGRAQRSDRRSGVCFRGRAAWVARRSIRPKRARRSCSKFRPARLIALPLLFTSGLRAWGIGGCVDSPIYAGPGASRVFVRCDAGGLPGGYGDRVAGI